MGLGGFWNLAAASVHYRIRSASYVAAAADAITEGNPVSCENNIWLHCGVMLVPLGVWSRPTGRVAKLRRETSLAHQKEKEVD